jgi:hypothetical protein
VQLARRLVTTVHCVLHVDKFFAYSVGFVIHKHIYFCQSQGLSSLYEHKIRSIEFSPRSRTSGKQKVRKAHFFLSVVGRLNILCLLTSWYRLLLQLVVIYLIKKFHAGMELQGSLLLT